MILVRFNGEEDMLEVSFKRTSDIVTLSGISEAKETGFCTFELDGVTKLGDFSNFKTIYRVEPNYVKLSNNGRVWRSPAPHNMEVNQ